jgi:hypothetical protein
MLIIRSSKSKLTSHQLVSSPQVYFISVVNLDLLQQNTHLAENGIAITKAIRKGIPPFGR